jgi:hypothetical protein
VHFILGCDALGVVVVVGLVLAQRVGVPSGPGVAVGVASAEAEIQLIANCGGDIAGVREGWGTRSKRNPYSTPRGQ